MPKHALFAEIAGGTPSGGKHALFAELTGGSAIGGKHGFSIELSPPTPFAIAEQIGDGVNGVGGGFCGGVRVQFTPTVDFHATGLAWAASTEFGGPTRVCRILAADGTELVRSPNSTTSFQGPNTYTPGPVLDFTAPLLVHAGTTYWAEAYVVDTGGTKYLNRRQTNVLGSSGSATFGPLTQRVNGSVDPAFGRSWTSPSGTVYTNQDNTGGLAYEHVRIYGY